MTNAENRRPLRVREWKIIRSGARWLSQRSITPNQISIVSIIFSALAGFCLMLLPVEDHRLTTFLCLLTALFILGRGLCNIFDGMVAVEGGKGTKSGELFNDIPDRISDILMLAGLGYAIDIVSWGNVAGWVATALALMTAYVRTLGRSLGAPTDFQGPMAKTHRMAIITLACLLTALWPQDYIFLIALLVIIVGCVMTIYNRVRDAYTHLENSSNA
jgi:phosphatidylglycerophosphate synthase